MNNSGLATGQRLDQWLWVSRLYRTRTLANESIAGGKVRVNGLPSKPARLLRPGDEVRLLRGDEPMTVVVKAIAARRVSAKDVPHLYEETAESLCARQTLRADRAMTGPSGYLGKGRPDKQQRRALQRLRDMQDE